jgi:hypothetical protein
MKTRIIHTKFWQDEYIGYLSPTDKLLFVYLLLNPHVGLCETYELPDRVVTFETGLTKEQLEKAKEKFSKDGKFAFYKGWIKILNYDRYNQYLGEKNLTAREKECSLIPKEVLEGFNGVSKEYRYPIDTTSNHKSEISNHKELGVVKREEITEEIIKEVAEKYQVPESFVAVCREEMENWLKAKGKIYKDKKAGLLNWVLRAKKDLLLKQKGGKTDRYGYTKVS